MTEARQRVDVGPDMPTLVRHKHGSDFVIAVIGRPLVFVVWAFLLWGTLYGAALAYATATEGASALGRVFYGGDPLLGLVSFSAAVLAAVVWSITGVFALINWRHRGAGAVEGTSVS